VLRLLSRIGLLEQRELIASLKNLSCRRYFFKKLTQFSQGNNVLDTPASNSNGFLSNDTYFSSPQLNRSTWNKESLSTP
jgi:hypothetical protein